MASLKRFKVTLYPVFLSKHSKRPMIQMTVGGEVGDRQRIIETTTVDDALAQAEAFAKEHGQACSISLRCLDKRKPAGFDQRTNGTMYRNMEHATER